MGHLVVPVYYLRLMLSQLSDKKKRPVAGHGSPVGLFGPVMQNMRDRFNVMRKGADGLDAFPLWCNATYSWLNFQMGDDEPPAKRNRGSSSVCVSMPVFYFLISHSKAEFGSSLY